MAYDQSPTNNRGIFIAGISAVVLLVGINMGLRSYFTSITETVIAEKTASPEALLANRAAERKALASGTMPLEQAMAQLGRQGRAGANGGADITPKPSTDLGALTGWNRMPNAAEPFVVPAVEGEAQAQTAPGEAVPAAVEGSKPEATEGSKPTAPEGEKPAAPEGEKPAAVEPVKPAPSQP